MRMLILLVSASSRICCPSHSDRQKVSKESAQVSNNSRELIELSGWQAQINSQWWLYLYQVSVREHIIHIEKTCLIVQVWTMVIIIIIGICSLWSCHTTDITWDYMTGVTCAWHIHVDASPKCQFSTTSLFFSTDNDRLQRVFIILIIYRYKAWPKQ